MRGIPTVLNTRQDVLALCDAAKNGQVDREELKRKLQELLRDEIYIFDKELQSADKADGTEPEYRVLVVQKEDKTIVEQWKLAIDPNAPYKRLGFEKTELEDIIEQL